MVYERKEGKRLLKSLAKLNKPDICPSGFGFYLSPRENFRHFWFPDLALLKEFELFVPWWLEKRGFAKLAFAAEVLGVHVEARGQEGSW